MRVELACHVLGQRDGAGERAGGKSKKGLKTEDEVMVMLLLVVLIKVNGEVDVSLVWFL